MERVQKEILHKHDLPAGFEDFPQPPKTFTWRTNSCFLTLAHSIQIQLTELYSDPNTAAFVTSPLINHAAWLPQLLLWETMHLSPFITFLAAPSASLPIPVLVLTHPSPSLHRWWPLITFQTTTVSVYWSANNFNVKGMLFFSSSFFESTASKIKKKSLQGRGTFGGPHYWKGSTGLDARLVSLCLSATEWSMGRSMNMNENNEKSDSEKGQDSILSLCYFFLTERKQSPHACVCLR